MGFASEAWNISSKLKRALYYQLGRVPVFSPLCASRRGSLIILAYHQVLPDPEFAKRTGPNTVNAVSEASFAKQIEFIRDRYPVIPLDRAAEWLSHDDRSLAVALTLDDGYRDNLTTAYPVLKKYECPATIFVATGFLEGDCSMWWHDLWHTCLNGRDVQVEKNGRRSTWNTADNPEKSYRRLRTLLLELRGEDLRKLQAQLFDGPPTDCSREFLSWEEIRALDEDDLITIGAHTHRHRALKQLSDAGAREEIESGSARLAENLGHSIEHFAYPYGTRHEFGDREVGLVRELGFATAVTMTSGKASPDRLLELPRFPVSDHFRASHLEVLFSGWPSLWGRPLR